MAESTLSPRRTEARIEIGHYQGWTRDSAQWSATETAYMDDVCESALRRIITCEPLPGEAVAHEWSWIKPITTLTMNEPYSTGTIALAAGGTTVTLTSGTFPSWAASGEMVISGDVYQVSTRTDDTHVVLARAYQGTVALTASNYTIRQVDYTMPDDFGGLDGSPTYTAHTNAPPIRVVSEYLIRDLRQRESGEGQPEYAAMRARTTDGTTGQRFALMFYPPPDDDYTIQYRYNLLPDALDATRLYPYGGMGMGELFIAACLAVAELRTMNRQGAMYADYYRQLIAAVHRDRRTMMPDTLGRNMETSEGRCSSRGNFRVTYNGVTY